jgi:lysophospholipase L1-like esterase
VFAIACGSAVFAMACSSTERDEPGFTPEGATPVLPGGAAGAAAEEAVEADPIPSEPAPAEPEPDDENVGLEPGSELPAGAGAGGSVGISETPAPGAGASGGAEPVPPVSTQPLTIWIAGDSTVANGNTPCPRGWGRDLATLFDDRVTVNNSAAGGRSVHTWLYEVQDVLDESGECALTRDASGAPLLQPRWQSMLDGMSTGDYLLIQFGINDGDPSCDRHVGLEVFQAAYGMMANAARARGANPVFLTPISAIACNGNTARGSRGEFVTATLEAGAALGVPVIDLHTRSVALYQSLGFCPVAGGDVSADTTGPVGDFFCDDHTHFSAAGAVVVAELVARAVSEQALPLASYLR